MSSVRVFGCSQLHSCKTFSQLFWKNLPTTVPGNVCGSRSSSSHSTDSRDVELSYTTYPDNQTSVDVKKSPLIFAHGLFGAKGNVHSLAKHLSSDGRKVITYDARNHGDSGHSSDFNLVCMSEDLDDLINELNLNQPVVLGHSMGGRTSMTLALHKPASLSTLIVADISPYDNNMQKQKLPTVFLDYAKAMKNVKINPDASIIQARKSAALQLAQAVPQKEILTFLLTNLRQYDDGSIRWRCNLDAIINNYVDFSWFPLTDAKPFHKPTLFVFGGDSLQYRTRDEDLIKKLFPMAQIEVIPGAGHFVHSEKPLEFTRIVKDFLKSINQ